MKNRKKNEICNKLIIAIRLPDVVQSRSLWIQVSCFHISNFQRQTGLSIIFLGILSLSHRHSQTHMYRHTCVYIYVSICMYILFSSCLFIHLWVIWNSGWSVLKVGQRMCLSWVTYGIIMWCNNNSCNLRGVTSSFLFSSSLKFFNFQVVAVGYAIMTTRTMDLNWKMRALRVLPMFLLPAVSSIAYSAFVSFTRMCKFLKLYI